MTDYFAPPDWLSLTSDLAYLGLIFALIVIPRALQRFRLPAPLSSLALGMAATLLLGPGYHDATLVLLATLGISSLFLFAGLEVDVDGLRRGRGPLLVHLAMRSLLLGAVTFGGMRQFGFAWNTSLLLALALLTPSTGFILESLARLGLDDDERYWVTIKAIGAEILALVVVFVVLQSDSATQLEVSTSTDGTNTISGSITTGDLGGLLAARSQVVNPAINQVGQIALALQQNANSLQNSGLDANGNFGANLFSATGPTVSASSNNTDAATAAATITNVGALTADNYVLSYKAGAYSLTDATSGATVALTGAGTAANPLLAASVGLAIVVTPAVPAAGDSFLISPTSQAAGSFAVALTSTSQLAAAGAIVTAAADANTGTATISAGTVTNAANPNLLAAATIAFTSPTTYTINGGAANAYTSGGNIAADGWQVQISGTPATGDVFTVQGNVGGTGDNRNALAAAAAQSQGVLSNGTISVNAAVSGLITGVGSQAQQINTSQTAQTAVNTQAQSAVQSVSGVNLDTEAANLLQWQQAYQAAAQVISTGNSLFTYLLDSINGTYT